MKKTFAALMLVLLSCVPAMAWDGFDSDSGSSVEIEQGNLVRSGQTMEYFDHSTGDYSTGEVIDVTRYGNSVEVEVYDLNSGENRTFDMDGN